VRIDPATTPIRDIYRVMIRCIVPRPIAWVSTRSADGQHNLAPFSFFTGVTSDPPSVLFCPGRHGAGGSKKDTLSNVEATGEFVVNVVTEALAQRMNDTAIDFPPEVDEFEVAGLTAAPSQVVSAPRVAESPVSLECRRLDVFHVGPEGPGGGAIVVGEIVMIHIDDAVVADGKVDAGLLGPIARLGGMEYTKLGERFVMPRRKPEDMSPG
jgi:flavin reductase (DIM6/NTAB) family NADH-FMN oxidoreductase RutF